MTWPLVSLGVVAEVQLGKMLSPKARTGASAFPYLRNVNVQWGRLELSDLVEMDFDAGERAKFALKKGDLLVCEGGEPGRSAIVERDLPDVFFQKALMRVRPRDGRLDARFLQRFMECAASRGTFARDGNQATIAHFPAVKLNALEVPLPPLPEQRRIADILDKADAIRRKRKEAIALTDELLRSAFLEMFGDPVSNPKGWEVRALGLLGKVTTGSTPPGELAGMFGGSVPFLTPGDLESGGVAKRTLSSAGAEYARTVRAGTALVCCIGATIGKMAKAVVRSAFNQQINSVEWGDAIDDDFALANLRFFKAAIASSASHTTLPILKKSSFERLEVPVPPLDAQRRYGELSRATHQLRRQAERGVADADALFGALVQRAFLGELRAVATSDSSQRSSEA